MADFYTPTTGEIRAVWGAWAEYGGLTNAPSGLMDDHYTEFDRWLAAHDAEVAERALRDAAGAYTDFDGDQGKSGVVRYWLRARADRIEREGGQV